jgi:hypothetical protein
MPATIAMTAPPTTGKTFPKSQAGTAMAIQTAKPGPKFFINVFTVFSLLNQNFFSDSSHAFLSWAEGQNIFSF